MQAWTHGAGSTSGASMNTTACASEIATNATRLVSGDANEIAIYLIYCTQERNHAFSRAFVLSMQRAWCAKAGDHLGQTQAVEVEAKCIGVTCHNKARAQFKSSSKFSNNSQTRTVNFLGLLQVLNYQ